MGKHLNTASTLPLVGRPTVSEFRFLAAVLRSGPIWILINSVKRRLLQNTDSAYLRRLFGILGSVVVNIAAVDIYSFDFVDMSRTASRFFFAGLDDYYTALKVYADQSSIERLQLVIAYSVRYLKMILY